MMESIFKLHSDMTRQGPGSNELTKQALDKVTLPTENVRVLDLGCGPGMQTIELARHINGEVTALDFHKPYLDELMSAATKANVAKRIKPLEASMFELEQHFANESFDLVWSEGAIYNMGFENGLKAIKPLLKEEGYIAVTEITWLKDEIPADLKAFWEEYPTMGTLDENIETIKSCGYEVVDTFTLPESAWWDIYYKQLKDRCEMFKATEPNNEELMSLIAQNEVEMDLYKRYSDIYGYVFYIIKNKK